MKSIILLINLIKKNWSGEKFYILKYKMVENIKYFNSNKVI